MHLPEMTAPATVAQLLAQARSAGLERLDAQQLLLHLLGRAPTDRAWLLAHDQDTLDAAQVQRYLALASRRLDHEPLAYVTGHKGFYGLELQVDARVLDPRPDTETLVDWALEVLAGHPGNASVIDLGTGSGAVALALQASRPALQVEALDFSADALAVAQANAQRLGLPVRFRQGAWLEGVSGTYHLVVSNPPYIAEQDPHLASLQHEPQQALTAGPDGLDDIRQIVAQAPARLRPGGWLLLEHGHDQASAVRALLAAQGFGQVTTRPDLTGTDRCSGGQWPANLS